MSPNFTSLFFILMSFIVVIYLFLIFKSKKRISLLAEFFFIGIYVLVGIIFLFPEILRYIEKTLGIYSAINFIVYCSIFIAYLIILMLYYKIEDQRIEITKLVREIAYLKNDKKK